MLTISKTTTKNHLGQKNCLFLSQRPGDFFPSNPAGKVFLKQQVNQK